jgi:sterol 3beta-glucosyltransferase
MEEEDSCIFRQESMPIYYAYSPTVLSPPVEWPDRMQVTGYWFLDPPPGWQPPADLLHFLQAGPAPVTIGFGNMASRDAEATLNLVLEALELSGQRGVLLSGWVGIDKGRTLPSHVFSAESLHC